MASTTFSGPVTSTAGFVGAVTGAITGNVTGNLTGNVTGNLTGGYIAPTPTAYSGADAGTKAVLPSEFNVTLTKGSAGTDYTLAAPGASNIYHVIRITSTGAHAHVLTVTGLIGGTTCTFGAAVGNGLVLYAVSATVWRIESNLGITQS